MENTCMRSPVTVAAYDLQELPELEKYYFRNEMLTFFVRREEPFGIKFGKFLLP